MKSYQNQEDSATTGIEPLQQHKRRSPNDIDVAIRAISSLAVYAVVLTAVICVLPEGSEYTFVAVFLALVGAITNLLPVIARRRTRTKRKNDNLKSVRQSERIPSQQDRT
jgi:hypothetical protein